MNVAVLKTKAEQALVESSKLPRLCCQAAHGVRELRSRAIGTFAALGLPHKRIEEWKYTDVRERLREVPPLAVAPAVALDGPALEAGLGRLASLPAYRIVLSMANSPRFSRMSPRCQPTSRCTLGHELGQAVGRLPDLQKTVTRQPTVKGDSGAGGGDRAQSCAS